MGSGGSRRGSSGHRLRHRDLLVDGARLGTSTGVGPDDDDLGHGTGVAEGGNTSGGSQVDGNATGTGGGTGGSTGGGTLEVAVPLHSRVGVLDGLGQGQGRDGQRQCGRELHGGERLGGGILRCGTVEVVEAQREEVSSLNRRAVYVVLVTGVQERGRVPARGR